MRFETWYPVLKKGPYSVGESGEDVEIMNKVGATRLVYDTPSVNLFIVTDLSVLET